MDLASHPSQLNLDDGTRYYSEALGLAEELKIHCALIPGTQPTRLPMFACCGRPATRQQISRASLPTYCFFSSATERSGVPSARRSGKVTDREYHPGIEAE